MPAEQVEIEVAGLDLGDQIETEWVLLNGISYDPRDDLLTVFTEGVDHNIPRPQTIRVDDGIDGLHSIEVTDADGHKQIVLLKEALKLPA